MPLAPQRSNPGTRGQNVRYDVRGYPIVDGRYFDGTYHYSGDPDNALSDDRPDSFVAGLYPADDERSRQWTPGQPRPNQAAPRLIGQASRMVQKRQPVSPAYQRASKQVAPVIAGSAAALIEALLGRSTRAVNEVNTRSSAIADALGQYQGKAAGYYDEARRGAQGVGDAVAAAIRGTGQALQGDVAGKLSGISAPGQALDTFAGGQARTGETAAAAASGLSSAELERLKGFGDAGSTMMGALPRIAALAGDTQRRGILNQATGELTDKLAELYGKEPGMILDAMAAESKAKADAAKQASLDAYRRGQLAASRGRLAESKRYHDLSAKLASGRLTVAQYNAETSRINAGTSQARLDATVAQNAQRNAQAWARVALGDRNAATSASRNQLAWEKFKANPTGDGRDGGYTKTDIAKLRKLAGEEARQAFKGYWALDDDPDTPLTQSQLLQMMRTQDVTTPLELQGVGKYKRSYQEAMSRLLGARVPLTMAQAALNRYWTKPGTVMPWDRSDMTGKPGGKAAGRPKVPFQERNPGKAGAAAETAANRWGGTTDPGGSLPGTSKPVVNRVLSIAHQQIGKPYVWGAESPSEGGFDCSGLIDWAYKQAGIDLPGRLTTYTAMRVGRSVRGQQMQPGDLLITNGGKHMVMYVGNNRVIAAPRTGEVVQYQPVSRFNGDIVDVRRIV